MDLWVIERCFMDCMVDFCVTRISYGLLCISKMFCGLHVGLICV
jgi:hypothetical protein